jgi:endonuclease/exonuclease/phosphatase family metal-dependent hydrolase
LFDVSRMPEQPIKPKEAKEALSRSMHELNADILTLVETTDEATLKRFNQEYLSDMGYKYIRLVKGNDGRMINVSVISRYPITNVRSHKTARFGVPYKDGLKGLSRDLLEVDLNLPKYNFTLFATHLKSQIGGRGSDNMRLAEAQEIERILRRFEQDNPDRPFALNGDMNDEPGSPVINTLMGKRDRDVALTDVLAELGPKAFTYHPIKYRGRIDFILLNQPALKLYQPKTAYIHQSESAFAGSDHLPATIMLK